jgi:hypothetical protein
MITDPRSVRQPDSGTYQLPKSMAQEELGDFTCPICGSSDFGTAVSTDGVITRHCHGYLPEGVAGKKRPCLFHWDSKDDAQYLLSWSDEETPTYREGK